TLTQDPRKTLGRHQLKKGSNFSVFASAEEAQGNTCGSAVKVTPVLLSCPATDVVARVCPLILLAVCAGAFSLGNSQRLGPGCLAPRRRRRPASSGFGTRGARKPSWRQRTTSQLRETPQGCGAGGTQPFTNVLVLSVKI